MNDRNSKYLITGGCGFIGSCLIRELLKNNQTVINIDKISYASNKDAVGSKNLDKYTLISSDINEKDLVKNILDEHNPDYVVHLAAESHVDRSIDNPENFINSNIVGTYTLLEASYSFWKNQEGDKKNNFRFIYVSTDEVYGSLNKMDKRFTEDSHYKPNSPYAASKASGDLLARSWFQTYDFPIITTNSSNNYGKWQFPEKLIPLVLKKCLKNENIPVYGNGSQIRDWINVKDHVAAIFFVLEKGRIGENYNIGASNEISNIDLVNLLCSLMDDIRPRDEGNYSDLITFVSDRPAHDFRYALDISKIKKELNWSPKISFDKGLKETIKWYLNNEDWFFKEVEYRYDGKRLGKIKK